MQSTNGNAFDALLLSVATARDMAAAAPSVPVHPWFAPRLGEANHMAFPGTCYFL
jgi:hypothetical protein